VADLELLKSALVVNLTAPIEQRTLSPRILGSCAFDIVDGHVNLFGSTTQRVDASRFIHISPPGAQGALAKECMENL
jgi:hypothetical protein